MNKIKGKREIRGLFKAMIVRKLKPNTDYKYEVILLYRDGKLLIDSGSEVITELK